MNRATHNYHPSDPKSNVAKLGSYDPDNLTLTFLGSPKLYLEIVDRNIKDGSVGRYILGNINFTVRTNECLTPGRPPRLTQQTIGTYLQPLTKELTEVPPRPTCDELPNTVLNRMLEKDKAFWVDKPGANAYTLHDAFYDYKMVSEKVLPTHQDVFPRSYQYDLDCVRYRSIHACDALKQKDKNAKPLKPHCRDCTNLKVPPLTPFQLAWAKDPGQKRWRYYPDLTATLTREELRASMAEVGQPYRNEACNWYNKNYPAVKYDCILRKFTK